MTLDVNWVPMKWPCGPLEIARRSKSQSADAEIKKTLEAWTLPSAIEILKETPVNCLIVDWARGEPQDLAQRQALKPLLDAGRRLGISFVGKVAAKDSAGAAIEAARSAGLSAVLLESPDGRSFDLPTILQFPRDKVVWETTSPIFSSKDNVWPGLGLETMKGDEVMAGPTGVPWVNSNAWFSLLARESAAGKKLWLDFDPPESSTVSHAVNYCLAIADSQTYGSRWIMSLDDKLRAAISQRNSLALGVWNKICETLAFFENHRGWEAFKSQGILAVVSDFRGEDAYLSKEVLNLLSRRQVQFLIIERAKSLSAPLEGLKAILWLDKEAPSAEQRSKLLAFVRQGGLAVAAAYWGPPEGKPSNSDPSFHYRLYNVGQGQIAVAEHGFADPYQVAVDTHLLVSHRNDIVRLYNPAATNCRSSIGPDHKKRLVQVLNYSSSPASFVTAWVNGQVSSAQVFSPGAKNPLVIKGVTANPGTEFDLPPISVYCALEFEGTKL